MRPLNIFILEDDPVSLKFLKHMLQNVLTKAPLDIESIHTAMTLKDAVSQLEDTPCDVILLDLDLPYKVIILSFLLGKTFIVLVVPLNRFFKLLLLLCQKSFHLT